MVSEKPKGYDPRDKLRKVHGNYDEYADFTSKLSMKGRSSILGNNVFQVMPRNVLPTLHQKTYFKACETIRMSRPVDVKESIQLGERRLNSTTQVSPRRMNTLQVNNEDMPAVLREIETNLEKLNPESKTFNQLDNIRFN